MIEAQINGPIITTMRKWCFHLNWSNYATTYPRCVAPYAKHRSREKWCKKKKKKKSLKNDFSTRKLVSCVEMHKSITSWRFDVFFFFISKLKTLMLLFVGSLNTCLISKFVIEVDSRKRHLNSCGTGVILQQVDVGIIFNIIYHNSSH